MLLRKIILLSPPSEKEEILYEYPWHLASPILRHENCILASHKPLVPPILVIPKKYVNIIDSEQFLLDLPYADLKYLHKHISENDSGYLNKEWEVKITQLKQAFSPETYIQRKCKTKFNASSGVPICPDELKDKIFEDNWIWRDPDVFSLSDIGYYQSIDIIQFFEANQIAISGKFVYSKKSYSLLESFIEVSCN